MNISSVRVVKTDAGEGLRLRRFDGFPSQAPGSSLQLKIIRDGVERPLSVKIGTMPVERQAAGKQEPESGGKIGVAVQDMNPEFARELGVPSSTFGVLIVEVQPESPASDSGLREGDIVQEVNRKPVKTVSEFRNAVSNSSNSILLSISRGGHTLYTVVDRKA